MSNIISNLLASFLIERFNKIILYIILTAIGLFSAIFLLFLKKPKMVIIDQEL